MPNMSHCRFTNTLQDLRDCFEHMDDGDLSPEEAKAQNALLILIGRMANDYSCEIEEAAEREAARRRNRNSTTTV